MHNEIPTKYYFISKFDTKHLSKQAINTGIIYRNYEKKINTNLILDLKKFCKKNKLKFFLSNNVRLALKLNLDGAYIPSFNKNLNHLCCSLKKDFMLMGSAHNIWEIKIKELQGVNLVFLSSIFKKNKNYLGINKFRLLINLTKKKVVALGGISKSNKKKLNLVNYFGFAGISYFE